MLRCNKFIREFQTQTKYNSLANGTDPRTAEPLSRLVTSLGHQGAKSFLRGGQIF